MEKVYSIWLIGLSGAGKTTLSERVERYLIEKRKRVQLLDGDLVRKDLDLHLGYDKENRIRVANIYRTMSKLLAQNGVWTVVSAIAGAEEMREKNRAELENYIEIFLDSSIQQCIDRDVKGLYRKALTGKEKNVYGLDLPFERPLNPDLTVDTENQTAEESFLIIKKYLDSLL